MNRGDMNTYFIMYRWSKIFAFHKAAWRHYWGYAGEFTIQFSNVKFHQDSVHKKNY